MFKRLNQILGLCEQQSASFNLQSPLQRTIQCIYKGGGRRLTQAIAATSARIKPAYLEPNRNTIQKPVEGLPVLPVFSAKKHIEKAEGKGAEKAIGAYTKVQPINKGAIVSQNALENSRLNSQTFPVKKRKSIRVRMFSLLQSWIVLISECSQRSSDLLSTMQNSSR